MNLTPHFTLEELTFSEVAIRQGIKNIPSVTDVENLRRLCGTVLEPARAILGVPLQINSGFRSPQVNALVGGVHASAHMEGRAADVVPIGMKLREAFDKLRANWLPYDQIILECDTWLHLAVPQLGLPPQRQALAATGGPGAWKYQLVGAPA